MKLIVMLRVKNGMLFASHWYDSISNLADEIVIVDNGSTDGTYEFFSNCSKVVNIIKTEGFNEGRDRSILLRIAQEHNPDWLMTLDIDEIFEAGISRKDLNRLMYNKYIKTWDFRLFHLLNDENHFVSSWRDIKELSMPRRSLFKNHNKLFVRDVKIHCGVEGRLTPRRISKLRIKHYCNLFKEYRLKAYENYLNIDENDDKRKLYLRDISILNNKSYPNVIFIDKNKKFSVLLQFYLLNILKISLYIKKRLLRK